MVQGGPGLGQHLHDLELNGIRHRLARHPSETSARVVLRALALALSPETLTPSGPGICSGETPTLRVDGPGGTPELWVEVGRPAVRRIERALRRAAQVRVVSCDVPPRVRVPRGRRLEWWRVNVALVEALASGLGRREAWSLEERAGILVVERGGSRYEGALDRHAGPGPASPGEPGP